MEIYKKNTKILPNFNKTKKNILGQYKDFFKNNFKKLLNKPTKEIEYH